MGKSVSDNKTYNNSVEEIVMATKIIISKLNWELQNCNNNTIEIEVPTSFQTPSWFEALTLKIYFPGLRCV